MVYGYARVSTKGQAKDGNSLDDQESKLKAAGAEVIYKESFTGTKKERPELDKLLSVISDGDTLVVTKLDRVARSIRCGAELIDTLTERGVTVNILNLGVLDNTASGKLMRNVFLAFAEFERDMIVERTGDGKAVAKANNPNFKEGRPRKECLRLGYYVTKYKRGEMELDECAEKLGISSSTFRRRIKEIEAEKSA